MAEEKKKLIQFKNIVKSFEDGQVVLKGVSLDIYENEFVTLLGPSGCGKTTLLRILGGFLQPSEGKVLFDGEDIVSVPPYKREINTVFQKYALFPHMDVYDNIAFGLTLKKEPKDVIEQKVMRMLRLVSLEDYAHRNVTELSGGQQQRVAIARTLAPEPTVLFMDEPLSNLDAKLRLEMRYELQRLHVETGSTFVYVTHDQMEAMTLATRICLINNGVLQQYAAPLEVYHKPANLFVADFVGNPSINFIEARGTQAADGSIALSLLNGRQAVFTPKEATLLADWFRKRDADEAAQLEEKKRKAGEKGHVEKGNKDEVFRYHIAKVNEEDDSLADAPELENGDFVLGIRPEFLDISDKNALHGEIYGAMPTGMESTIKVRVGDFLLTGVIFGSSLFTIGTEVPVSVSGDDIMLFDRRSGRCICLGSLKF